MPSKKKEAPLVVSIDGMSDGVATISDDDTVTVEVAATKPVVGRIIAIVGFAETSRMQVSAEPDTTEIWSLNRCYVFLKRWDVWFELHEEDLYSGKTGLREAGYTDLLKNSKMPIYMQHPNSDFPTSQQFPQNEIIEMFRDYFTTSIAYMLAMVAYQHRLGDTVTEMHMYGVDMSAFSEYSEQLPCVNFWLGVLEGMGIKVVIPSVSPLLKCAMQYGRHGEKPLQKMAKERLLNHKEKQAQLTADVSAANGISNEYGSIFKVIDDLITVVKKRKKPIAVLLEEFKEALKNRRLEINQYHSQVLADLNSELGGLRETQHWIVALNAAQDEEEEPVSAKMPTI